MNREYLTKQAQDLIGRLGKYKYPILILLLGVCLMLLPQRQEETVTELSAEPTVVTEAELEKRLETILGKMEGVGKVTVMLTMETGPVTTYHQDIRSTESEDRIEIEKETILITDSSGDETPVSVKTTYPVYKGAVVVCQGAGRASVKLDIIRAVSSLTGLGSDKIAVIKMKGY